MYLKKRLYILGNTFQIEIKNLNVYFDGGPGGGARWTWEECFRNGNYQIEAIK